MRRLQFSIGSYLSPKSRGRQASVCDCLCIPNNGLGQLNYTTSEKELLAIVFALDKFCSYLLCSKIIVFSDHAALRFLLKMLDAKLRLIWWMLLLQEFKIEIKDKKGVKNSIVDHLSRIERESDPMPIRDEFLDEQLFFHQRHPGYIRRNSEAMPSIIYGMILTFRDIVMIKSFISASQILRSSRSSNFAMQHLEAAIIKQLGQPEKCLIVGSTGPPFLRCLSIRLHLQQMPKSRNGNK
ncbi:Retrovirus-related Pol polyprotein from transposon 17.6, partial [Mucuna pruriens]